MNLGGLTLFKIYNIIPVSTSIIQTYVIVQMANSRPSERMVELLMILFSPIETWAF